MTTSEILAKAEAKRKDIERKMRLDKAINGGVRYLVLYAYNMRIGDSVMAQHYGWGEAYTLDRLHETHAVVAYIEVEDGDCTLDDIFTSMQGENWSPNGEAWDMIKDAEVSHTSMSVGDIIYDTKLGIAWECGDRGWHIMLPAYVRRNLAKAA